MTEFAYLLVLLAGAVVGYAARGRLEWHPQRAIPPEVCLRELTNGKDILDTDRARLGEIVAELTGSHAKLVDVRGQVSYRHASSHQGWVGRNTELEPLTPFEKVLKVADAELSRAIDALALTPVRLSSPRSEW